MQGAWRCCLPALLALAAVAVAAAPAAASSTSPRAQLQRQLDALVATPGGPPGAIVTLHRGRRTTVLRAGVADVRSRRKPRATDHMRIASIAKAFTAAVVFRLVWRDQLRLGDTIGELRPDLPRAWAAVTVRQLLNHTSGVPDYTQSDGFRRQFMTDPGGYVPPSRIISWVRGDGLDFTPGSRYEYSNTDNIVLGLIAQRRTGERFARLLRMIVIEPLGLTQTSFPSRPPLPRPYIHGYTTAPGQAPEDVSTLLSPSGAWASGAVVSTPYELNRFVRAYLSGRHVPPLLQRLQLRFERGGRSSPPGPGANSAGLGVFRYRSRCGTVYGHTGNFPGYVQWAAATRDGKRGVTSSLNIPAPSGELLARLREAQATAVCALLRD